jgi:hypothetical protein
LNHYKIPFKIAINKPLTSHFPLLLGPGFPPSVFPRRRHQLNSHILQHPAPQRTEVGGVEEGLELLQVAGCGRWQMDGDGADITGRRVEFSAFTDLKSGYFNQWPF